MKTYNFTIEGNHKSPTGNAMPKLKMTGNQSWTPRAKEYVAWKSHVQYAFMKSLSGKEKLDDQRMFASNMARFGKPFVKGMTVLAMMIIGIHWSNKAHGDPENIFGSIADALFKDDKNLDCISLAAPAKEKLLGKPKGKVDVCVRIFRDADERSRFINELFNFHK